LIRMDPKEMAMQALRWLKKANAKAVFACLLASLIAISSIWTLRLMSEVRTPRIIASNQGRKKTMLPLGILDLVASIEQTVVDSFPSVSPFAGAPAQPNRKNPREKRPRDEPKHSFFNRFTRPPKRTNAPPVNVVQKPETVSLIYKGVFRRSDGVTMALIEDSKSGRSRFYGAGADVFGMTLKGVEMETIEISQEDGDPIELKRDLSAVFVEGKYVP
jgi:hypothetical protein